MGEITYEGCHLMSVASYGLNLITDHLKTKSVTVWTKTVHFTEIFVIRAAARDVKEILTDNEVPFKVLFHNLQDAIQREQHEQSRILARLKNEGRIVPWMAYHRLSDIYNFLDVLVDNHRGRVQVVCIGRTYECRETRVVVIRSGLASSKKLWIDGGIHAREWITTAAVMYIIHQLVVNYKTLEKDINNIDFYISPVLNPDGYEYSHTADRLWRNNRCVLGSQIGVDMNRSFCDSLKPRCDDCCQNVSKFPDREVQQIVNFIRQNKKGMKGFLTFHNFSQLVLYPYGKEMISYPSDYDEVVRVGREIAAAISTVNQKEYKAVEIKDYCPTLQGNSVDWAKSEGIAFSYAIELRPSDSEEYPGFIVPHEDIIPTAEEAFAGVLKLASIIAASD